MVYRWRRWRRQVLTSMMLLLTAEWLVGTGVLSGVAKHQVYYLEYNGSTFIHCL